MKIFVAADLHLGHSNIIKYCNRPFENVDQMNYILINNWNNIIRPGDKVYFLGDLSFRSLKTEEWIKYLNGDIIFIRGNHDNFNHTTSYNKSILKYKDRYFYLTHRPEHIPHYWQSYSIHGHKHNNNIIKYPFYNRSTKRFNVSCELTGYKPVDMDDIIQCIV